MLSDLERRVKILQCLSTSLTKIHSARATGGGGHLPRVMACTWWRRWGQNRAISHTSLVLFRGHFPNKNEAIRTSDSDASWTCCAYSLFQSSTRVHRCDSVHLHKDNVVSNKQRVLFSSQPFWRSTTEIRCCLQPFKQNSELVLLDSIAAAVESQTIITCEQLRNIPKNIKEFVEWGETD